MTRLVRVLSILVVVTIVAVASACSSKESQSPQPPREAAVTTTSAIATTSVPATTSTTAAPATTTSTTIPPPTTTSVPSPCPDVDGRVLSKLSALKFFDPAIDGCSSEAIFNVVAGFQKYYFQPLEVTGVLDPRTAQAILEAQPIVVKPGKPTRIDVDIEHQLLYLIQDSNLVRAQHVSTGRTSLPTPTGEFEILMHAPGNPPGEDSDNPMYLYRNGIKEGNVALHGYPVVPINQSASHGCVRMPLGVNRYIYDIVDAMTSPMPVNIF